MSYCAEGKIGDGQTLLVYDFGGGAFDAALIRYQDGKFQAIVDPMGLEHCGGIDIDRMIYENMMAAAAPYALEAGITQNRLLLMRLQAGLSELAVQAKCHLSTAHEFSDGFAVGMEYVDYALTVEQLNQMIAGLVQRSIDCCRSLLSSAGMAVSGLGGILLVGGTSRVPLVEQMVQRFAEGVPVLANINPELAVAQGAIGINLEKKPTNIIQEVELQPPNDETHNIGTPDPIVQEEPRQTAQVKNMSASEYGYEQTMSDNIRNAGETLWRGIRKIVAVIFFIFMIWVLIRSWQDSDGSFLSKLFESILGLLIWGSAALGIAGR